MVSAEGIVRLMEAAQDLRWLLSRGYPKEASLTLVGNRFELDKELREVLKRAVLPPQVAQKRKGKVLDPKALNGKKVAIDGHNILITLQTALKGGFVFFCDDGFLRDTAGVSRSFVFNGECERALDLVLETLAELKPNEVMFFLDAPLSKSRELAQKINLLFGPYGIRGKSEVLSVPEKALCQFEGVICTADGHLLDLAQKTFDLAGYIVKAKLRWSILSFET